MRRIMLAIFAVAAVAAVAAEREPAPPGWSSPAAFAAKAEGWEAREAEFVAVAWDRRQAAMKDAGVSTTVVLFRRGRLGSLPYPAGMAEPRCLHVRPRPAGDLPEPGPSVADLAGWLRSAFRDGLDPDYATARAELGDPAFCKADGTPKPAALAQAVEDADSAAAVWAAGLETKPERIARIVRAWARFRSEGRGAPSIPAVAEAELTAVLEWASLRTGGRFAAGTARDALSAIAVAWMARKRPEALRSLTTMDVVTVRGLGAAYGAVVASAGQTNVAALMAAAKADGYDEGGAGHRAAALALLSESREGAWGVPEAVRRDLRRAMKGSRAVPIVTPTVALAALDGISGMAEPAGSPGRAGDEEAVAAAFREPPLEVAAWATGDEWAKRSDDSATALAAAKRVNLAMGEALDAYEAWSKEADPAKKPGLASLGRAAVDRLRGCLDKDAGLLPPALVAKGRDVAVLAESRLGK
jgi:hypothetical protein